jgi:hypothetical protein
VGGIGLVGWGIGAAAVGWVDFLVYDSALHRWFYSSIYVPDRAGFSTFLRVPAMRRVDRCVRSARIKFPSIGV